MSTSSTEEKIPENANEECVGPSSKEAGKSSACEGCPNQKACSSGEHNTPAAQEKARQETLQLKSSLSNVSHTILVLSGKGGVGKSTVSCQLAHTLAHDGYAVGLLDVDLCGPSAPRMILGDYHTKAQIKRNSDGAWEPVYNPKKPNLCCMSISFLLPDDDRDRAVIWRGPKKNGIIQQFLTQVDWTGQTDGLDYLIVDTPPGTSDEHISTVQYLQQAASDGYNNSSSTTGTSLGAIVVTTPEEVCMADVRKELNFCQKTNVPVMGIVENMGQYTTTIERLSFITTKTTTLAATVTVDHHQQHQEGKEAEEVAEVEEDCTQKVLDTLHKHCPELFRNGNDTDKRILSVTSTLYPRSGGGPKAMAAKYNIPYWGKLPMDPDLLQACEHGRTFVEDHPHSLAAASLKFFCNKIRTELPVEEL